ncbi:synaptotagmin-4-like isoform X2 [Syngnathoides biaculeatus]|uniref:synaptotagmin-4-like isoform X2 n=1 Tax=Syngnathoides biaculeatus TaxID=300417 RepID=UPI002ADDAF41|nr:synaptotagmin-4-like isoform X2 [Syngnathoides biaculeatus]
MCPAICRQPVQGVPSGPKIAGIGSRTPASLVRDVQMSKGLICPPQIFILLHYNPHTHRIKVAVLRADNLENLIHTSTTADYQVMIKLHHDGLVISSRETKQTSFAVWNSYFLFDLPPGDISRLALMVEFIIIQSHARSQCKVLGRVLIGAEAPDVGRAHWRDMCNLQGERSRWHTVLPEPS